MTEHTFKARVVAPFRTPGVANSGRPTIQIPHDCPVGAEVTVTWTELPEPTGQWVVVTDTNGRNRGEWRDNKTGITWSVHSLASTDDRRFVAEAALVDLIESDHLPPQMPNVDDIDDWLANQGYRLDPYHGHRAVIRGTLDAIAALAAHGRTRA